MIQILSCSLPRGRFSFLPEYRIQNQKRHHPKCNCHKKLRKQSILYFRISPLAFFRSTREKRHTTQPPAQTTIMTPQPLATTASITNSSPFDGVSVKRTRTHGFSHNPVVMAMITNNRLSNCRDVAAMMEECQVSMSRDQVCRTAANYFDICMHSDNSK